MRQVISASAAVKEHWPEYLIEGWALGTFLISAGLFSIWLEQPGIPLHHLIGDPSLRRAIVGLAMGITAILLIYSPWGRRSGAHMNPAVTLAFLSLGRVSRWDAAFYVMSQFAGGLLGVLVVWALYGAQFSQPAISFIATRPGSHGEAIAFIAEGSISFLTMTGVLVLYNSTRLRIR
jgi:aquaporin Z